MSCKNNTERYVGGKSRARMAEPTLWAGLVAIELTSSYTFRIFSIEELPGLDVFEHSEPSWRLVDPVV